MNDQIAERIAIALEMISLDLANIAKRTEPVHPPVQSVRVPLVDPAAAPFRPIGWVCPEHGTSRVVPAGISSRTQQPYAAFLVCGQPACPHKPPRFPAPAPLRVSPQDGTPRQMP